MKSVLKQLKVIFFITFTNLSPMVIVCYLANMSTLNVYGPTDVEHLQVMSLFMAGNPPS